MVNDLNFEIRTEAESLVKLVEDLMTSRLFGPSIFDDKIQELYPSLDKVKNRLKTLLRENNEAKNSFS